MAKAINAFPWVNIEELFEIRGEGSSARGVIKSSVPAAYKSLLRKGKGIYLLGSTSAKSPKKLGAKNVIYIGEAGGIGDGSTFEQRVSKHFQKALGHHNQAGGSSGISISKRWLEYVAGFGKRRPTEKMYLRLLDVAGATESDKARITELEDLLMCYWSNASTGHAIEPTPCNTKVASLKRQAWYFSAPVEALDRATMEQAEQAEEEISEDAEMDFQVSFHALLDEIEEQLNAAGLDVSRRGDRMVTIWVRLSHVAMELNPLVGKRLVRVRRRGAPGSSLLPAGELSLTSLRSLLLNFAKGGKG